MNFTSKIKLLAVLFFSFSFFLAFTSPAKAIWNWEQIVDDGFGRTGPFTGENIFALYNWRGCIYAGIEGHNTTEGAVVYRSCDGKTFTRVNEYGFGDPAENDHVDSIVAFGDYLYVSTAVRNENFNGFKLYRSLTGDLGSWETVISDGAGSSTNENLKDMTIYNGELCGGTWNDVNGAAVLCSPDGTTWRQVNTYGFGNSNNKIAWISEVFNDYLYVAVQNNIEGGELWRTNDLSNWEKIIDQGYGYGTNELFLRSATTFGDYLYIFAKNGADNNLQLLRTSDGTTFTQATTFDMNTTLDGPIGPSFIYDNYMYTSLADFTNGTVIYRSNDGVNWEALSIQGVDGSNNNTGGFITEQQGYLYIGLDNTSLGQQVWRALIPVPAPLSTPGPARPSPGCTDRVTQQTPELFQVDTTQTSATIFFTPVTVDVQSYVVEYGLSEYSEANYAAVFDKQSYDGVQIIRINDLTPNANYYFRVKPLNGCAGGEWSNQLNVSTTAPEQAMIRRHYLYTKIIDFISNFSQ